MPLSSLLRNAGAASLAVAVLGTLSLGAFAAPASAQANGNAFYSVELAAPAAERTSIIGGSVWQCQGTTCVGAKSGSRPIIMCQRVVRELGEVAAFTAKGEALADKDLARCNGK